MRTFTTLDQAPVGSASLVVNCDGMQELLEPLAARGIVPGAEVAVMQSGDPLLVLVGNARWAIRREQARSISVTVLG